jgi:large conductance mechanosensitive channel
MAKGFVAFLSRGNVVDLAVAVVIGAAFTGVVTALVKDLITPLIAALAGKPDFSALHFTINSSVFAIGDFLNALVSFVVVAAAIYFLVVSPTKKLASLRAPNVEEAPVVATCPECLSEIPAAAKRCKYCTAVMVPA